MSQKDAEIAFVVIVGFIVFRLISIKWLEPWLASPPPSKLDQWTTIETSKGCRNSIFFIILMGAIVWFTEPVLTWIYPYFGASYHYSHQKTVFMRIFLTPVCILLIGGYYSQMKELRKQGR